ncbi:Scr1 family TA system antitoxin-like transcriptional regulator [Actinomadura sp. WMMB 499]|uniref:Scr1 family TA system antitoxin-like transcriptional regulator n=1 Tax=Actinomadura sp. WMMB 499 TaxID=1219491 RepID=UPI0034A0B736
MPISGTRRAYGDVFIEGAEQVARCRLMFDRIWDAALDENSSERFITDIASEL